MPLRNISSTDEHGEVCKKRWQSEVQPEWVQTVYNLYNPAEGNMKMCIGVRKSGV